MALSRGNIYQIHMQLLRQNTLCRHLQEPELAQLLSWGTWAVYRRGARIATPEDRRKTILLIVRGMVRLVRVSCGGRTLIVDMLEAGGSCGLLVDDPVLQPKTVVEAVLDGTMVCRLPAQPLAVILASRPQCVLNVFAMATGRLLRAYDHSAELGLCDVRTRLGHALAQLALADEQHHVTAHRDELAALIGTSREEVTRGLAYFRASGLISFGVSKQDILVHDPHRLAALEPTLHRRQPNLSSVPARQATEG